MKRLFYFKLVALSVILIFSAKLEAKTNRQPLLKNKNVSVWRTTIYPQKENLLPQHRHTNDRVLIALTDGTLKIKTNKNKTSFLKLESGKAYYLKKDPEGETHSDVNVGKTPVKVIVVDLIG